MKYTSQQIENTICKWSSYLLENKLATEKEVKDMLDEGLFKRAKTYVKNAFKHVGQGIAQGAKTVALKVHDTFAANAGVKQLMQAIGKIFNNGKKKAKEIKLFIRFNKTTYPVADFALSKNRKTLALLFDDKTKKAKTYEDLDKFLLDNKISGNDKHVTDFVDSLIIGKIEDEDMLTESSPKSSRLVKILDALGWTSKKALKDENIQNIMNLLGMKNKTTVAGQIAEYFKSNGEKGVDDPTISSDDPSSDSKSDFSKDDEEAKDDENDKKDKENKEDKKDKDKEEPSFDSDKPEKQSVNTALMKTRDGRTIGVMDNPFKEVRTDGNLVGVLFDISKAEAEILRRQKEALRS